MFLNFKPLLRKSVGYKLLFKHICVYLATVRIFQCNSLGLRPVSGRCSCASILAVQQ